MKTWQGSLAVSQYEGIVSPAYFVCGLSPDVNPRFAHHLLRSRPYIHLYQAASKGIRPSQWDLPFEEFQRIPMLLPPLDEQRRIADFLDAETARIDSLMTVQRQAKGVLLERRAANAFASVTGSDIAERVPSKLAWADSLPAAWRTAALAGWSTLPGLALIADQPGGPGTGAAPERSCRSPRWPALCCRSMAGKSSPGRRGSGAGATPPRAVSMTSRTNRSFSGA